MKALRVFYKDNQVIWTHGLEGTGTFPTTVAADLKEHPQGTACITLDKTEDIEAFHASDDNTILDGKLTIGQPRPEPEPRPEPRDLGKEVDSLKTELRLGGFID